MDELDSLEPGDAVFISCSVCGGGCAGKCAYCGEIWSECACLCEWMDCACGERKEDVTVQMRVRESERC